MRAGVRDCVSDDQLGRLVPAVAREAAATRERREHRALEVQLRHAQRMEAVGRLASGIAHDFSNLLTVTGYTELLLDRLDPHDSLREVAEDIRSPRCAPLRSHGSCSRSAGARSRGPPSWI